MARTWTLSDFDVSSPELGRGKFGRVFSARERASGVQVALKTISQTHVSSDERLKQLRREIELQCRLYHPHILRLYGYFWDKKMLVMVLQFAPNGTLFDLITKSGPLAEQDSKRCVREIASALAYIHSLGAIHRDIKPENILLGPENQCLLADFGWAAVVPKTTGKRYTLCGTVSYLAPEVAAGRAYDSAADVWSLGVLMYEVMVGSCPHNCAEVKEVAQLRSLRLPEQFGERGRDLCGRMLEVDPRRRPAASEVLHHSWLCS